MFEKTYNHSVAEMVSCLSENKTVSCLESQGVEKF